MKTSMENFRNMDELEAFVFGLNEQGFEAHVENKNGYFLHFYKMGYVI